MSFARLFLVVVVAVAIPMVVSQILPNNGSASGAPVVPLALLAVLGAVAGWVAPTVRGWIVTALWVVASAALIFLSWTDLVLDVAPALTPVDTWRMAAFAAILGSVGTVSLGFIGGAAVRRRGVPGAVGRPAIASIAVVAIACVVGAAATAAAFAASPLVLQPNGPTVHVVVTDAGLEVTPETIDTSEYRLVIESGATGPVQVAWVTPLNAEEGRPRAMSQAEIDTWLSGDWAALEPAFHVATMSFLLEPGERLDGGKFRLATSPDGTGGGFWYAADHGDLRPWPSGAYDGDGPEPAPWPITDHAVVPVAGP